MSDHVELITESLFKSKLGMWFACQAGAKELLAALDAAKLQIVKKSLVEYAWKQSGQHVRMMDRVEDESERLRAALTSIADKTQEKETNLEMLLGEIYDAVGASLLHTPD